MVHSHDNRATWHEHLWGESPHHHSDDGIFISDTAHMTGYVLANPPAPTTTPTPAPVPAPAETEYNRRYRLITEREGFMWQRIGIIAGSIVLGIVALWFVLAVWPVPQIVDSFDNGDAVNNTVVTDKVVATDQVMTEAQAKAMVDAAVAKATASQSQTQPADNGNANTGTYTGNSSSSGQPAQSQPVQGSSEIGSVNDAASYGNDPETYVPHPLSYQETGIKGAVSWTLELLPNTTLIVGGFTVDGTSGGVYKAIKGGQTVKVTVTDGFYSIVPSEWGQNEYDFRIGEAEKYGWAMAHLSPLPEWKQ